MIGFCLFIINKSYFDELNDKERIIIEDSARKSVIFQRALASKEDGILLNKMKKKGVKVTSLSLNEIEKFKNKTKKYHNDFFKEFPLMKEFI